MFEDWDASFILEVERKNSMADPAAQCEEIHCALAFTYDLYL